MPTTAQVNLPPFETKHRSKRATQYTERPSFMSEPLRPGLLDPRPDMDFTDEELKPGFYILLALAFIGAMWVCLSSLDSIFPT